MKQPLHAVAGWRGPPTARQVATWRAWLELEWDRPSRADWYAMQTAATIMRGALMQAGATSEQVREANFRLAFVSEATQVPADQADADEEEYQNNLMAISKARALAMRGDRAVVERAAPLPQEEIVEEQPDLTVADSDDPAFAALAARINADAAAAAAKEG